MLQHNDCTLCAELSMLRAGAHPRFIAELPGVYVVLHEYQYFPGYMLAIPKDAAASQRELRAEYRLNYLAAMANVHDALQLAAQPREVHVAEFGGANGHIHWHIVPRYGTDVAPLFPPWSISREIREAHDMRATSEMVFGYKQQIRSALQVLGVKILQ